MAQSTEQLLKPCQRRLTRHTDPAGTVLYVRLEPGEQRQAPAITAGGAAAAGRVPDDAASGLTKDNLAAWYLNAALTPPRLYRLGFSHNNFL